MWIFYVIKNHGLKNPPPGCNLGPKFAPHVGRSPKKNWQQFRPYIKKSMSILEWLKYNLVCRKCPKYYSTTSELQKPICYNIRFPCTAPVLWGELEVLGCKCIYHKMLIPIKFERPWGIYFSRSFDYSRSLWMTPCPFIRHKVTFAQIFT